MTPAGSSAEARVETDPGLTCSRRLPSVKKGRCGRKMTPRGPKQVSILMLPAETHSWHACSASQQLPTSPWVALPHEAANKSQRRHICYTGQNNESQSRVCDRDRGLQCISDTFVSTSWHWSHNPTMPPSKLRAALVQKEKAVANSSPYPVCSPTVPQGPSGEMSSLCQCFPQSSHCFLVRS